MPGTALTPPFVGFCFERIPMLASTCNMPTPFLIRLQVRCFGTGQSSRFLLDQMPRRLMGFFRLYDEGKRLSMEESWHFREAIVALRLAKEMINNQQSWRANVIPHLNKTGGFSRSLANSCTDWPCLLLELLSEAAVIDHFQRKLVINNIEVLQNAILTNDSTVSASMYHDSLIWSMIALGANERSLLDMLVHLIAIIHTGHSSILDFQTYLSLVRPLDGLRKKLKCIW